MDWKDHRGYQLYYLPLRELTCNSHSPGFDNKSHFIQEKPLLIGWELAQDQLEAVYR